MSRGRPTKPDLEGHVEGHTEVTASAIADSSIELVTSEGTNAKAAWHSLQSCSHNSKDELRSV